MVRVDVRGKRPTGRRLGKAGKSRAKPSIAANAGLVGYLKSWLPGVFSAPTPHVDEGSDEDSVIDEDVDEDVVVDDKDSNDSAAEGHDVDSAPQEPISKALEPNSSDGISVDSKNRSESNVKALHIGSTATPHAVMSTPLPDHIRKDPMMSTPIGNGSGPAPALQTISPQTVRRRGYTSRAETGNTSLPPSYSVGTGSNRIGSTRSLASSSMTEVGPRRRALPLKSPFRRMPNKLETSNGESLKRGRGYDTSPYGADQARPVKRRVVPVSTTGAVNTDGLTSDTAKRILNAINKVSSPLTDASRIANFQPSKVAELYDPRQRSPRSHSRIPRTSLPSSAKRDPFRFTPRMKRSAPAANMDKSVHSPTVLSTPRNESTNSSNFGSKTTVHKPTFGANNSSISTSTPKEKLGASTKQEKISETKTANIPSKSSPSSTSLLASTNSTERPTKNLKTSPQTFAKTSPADTKVAQTSFSFASQPAAVKIGSKSSSPLTLDSKKSPDKESLSEKSPAPAFQFKNAKPIGTPDEKKTSTTGTPQKSFTFSSSTPISSKTVSTAAKTPVSKPSTPVSTSGFEFSPAKSLNVSKSEVDSSPAVLSSSFQFAKGSPVVSSTKRLPFAVSTKKQIGSDTNEDLSPKQPSSTISFGGNKGSGSKPSSSLAFGSTAGDSASNTSTKLQLGKDSLGAKTAQDDVKPASGFTFGAKPADSKPAEESKPASGFTFGAKPADSKPAEESKPASGFTFGAKPADSKPAEESKPASGFTFGAKPADSKPVEESKPASGFTFEIFNHQPHIAFGGNPPPSTGATVASSPLNRSKSIISSQRQELDRLKSNTANSGGTLGLQPPVSTSPHIPSADAAIAEFYYAFDKSMDKFINSDGDFILNGEVDRASKQEAVCQIIASNATCSKWTSGKLCLLFNNKLGDEAGKAIGKALETNSTLKRLDFLFNNKLGDEAGTAIGKALETNSTLNTLYLLENNLGDEAGKAIGKALETNSTLKKLDLNKNKIGDEAGKTIGKALETNSTLNTLALFYNRLGDEAGKAIGKALETNSTLNYLDLSKNKIGDEAGKTIGKALETNSTLNYLDLRCNKLSESTKKSIKSKARSDLTVRVWVD